MEPKRKQHIQNLSPIFGAVSQTARVSVHLLVCLPVCLPACLSVSPQAAGCLHHSYVLCFAKFTLESSLSKRAVRMLDAGLVARLKREGGREEMREGDADVHRVSDRLKQDCVLGPLFNSYMAMSVAAAVLHKPTLTSLLLDFIHTHT